ncbi:hypothetical protein C8F04DRAFT_154532 [Mycena alexandri]|uniref:BRCT domain-containing protein n=1 Tax=Mycena alexandri TaxID=1745969 RepID=A0AAD6SBY6_9AGAR|nr:hypothetical protein C8F04DRAFT_154532 [Mycena alexandri]
MAGFSMLSQALKALGATVTDDYGKATHSVAPAIRVTAKFLCPLSAGAAVVTPNWVKDCITVGRLLRKCFSLFLGCSQRPYHTETIAAVAKYRLRDTSGEALYGFSLRESERRARKRQSDLFEGMSFYLMPSLAGKRTLLSQLVEFHGGKVGSWFPDESCTSY